MDLRVMSSGHCMGSGRPNDGLKGVLIWLDKKMVAAYSNVKSRLGINDDFVSRILNVFSRKKK